MNKIIAWVIAWICFFSLCLISMAAIRSEEIRSVREHSNKTKIIRDEVEKYAIKIKAFSIATCDENKMKEIYFKKARVLRYYDKQNYMVVNRTKYLLRQSIFVKVGVAITPSENKAPNSVITINGGSQSVLYSVPKQTVYSFVDYGPTFSTRMDGPNAKEHVLQVVSPIAFASQSRVEVNPLAHQIQTAQNHAVDIYAPIETDIISNIGGVVVLASNGAPDYFCAYSRYALGNDVVILDDKGYEHSFVHMQLNSIRVHEGQRIKKGDLIGKVGVSGASVEPHLHYQITSWDKDNKIVIPKKILFTKQ